MNLEETGVLSLLPAHSKAFLLEEQYSYYLTYRQGDKGFMPFSKVLVQK